MASLIKQTLGKPEMANVLKIKIWLIILCLGCFNSGFAQIIEQKQDSTDAVYEKIKEYADISHTTKVLHWLVFKSNKKRKSTPSFSDHQDYKDFEGKIVRRITIETHDPFGFSFTDTTETANSWLEKTGNRLHLKSKEFAIRNLLIFKKHQPLDSLLVRESQRLIRTQDYIRSVEFKVEPVGKSSDSVDVHITTLDYWSLTPGGSISNSKMKFKLKEKNYLGYGHQLRLGVENRFSDGKVATELLYIMPNFKNTYIGATIGHRNDLEGFYKRHFDISRPFYSPYTKWAGGIYLTEHFKEEILSDATTEISPQRLKYQTQDYWGGYSHKLFKGRSERERSANIIGALRLQHTNYKEKPPIAYDSIHFFSNETYYLGSIGISSRQFKEDAYIFRDGIIETVPTGDIYAITGGRHYKNNQHRWYVGAKVAHGDYYDWGYISATFEYGTYFNQSKPEQTAFSFSANYFTNLIYLGEKWKMRQFIKPQILIGKNRLNSRADRLTIDEPDNFKGFYEYEEPYKHKVGIPGFKSGLVGISKYVLSLRTQFYPPWQLIGFRFNPYLDINAAMLDDDQTRAHQNKIYTSLGVGLIIRNDYLVFNSIQLSLSYYPNIPGQGHHIFNTNSLRTKDYGLSGFELGKPSTIWYN